jgi:hypothetical protein
LRQLHQIVHDADVGRRVADKLFKVWRNDGSEAWLLIHVEVQGRREEAFAERMFIYSYRIYDLYRKPVVSLAVLCDAEPGWRPDRFAYNICGCEMGLRFLTSLVYLVTSALMRMQPPIPMIGKTIMAIERVPITI